MVGIAKGCAHVLTSVLDIPYEYGSFAIIAVTCAYTIWGGMYSVLWTDAIQGIIMFGVAILMLAIPFMYVGGVDNLFEAVSNTEHLTKARAPIKIGPRNLWGIGVIFIHHRNRSCRRDEANIGTQKSHPFLFGQ